MTHCNRIIDIQNDASLRTIYDMSWSVRNDYDISCHEALRKGPHEPKTKVTYHCNQIYRHHPICQCWRTTMILGRIPKSATEDCNIVKLRWGGHEDVNKLLQKSSWLHWTTKAGQCNRNEPTKRPWWRQTRPAFRNYVSNIWQPRALQKNETKLKKFRWPIRI